MRSNLKNRATVSSTARAQSSEGIENVPVMASPYHASNEGSCFKENININKSETPKLALEPQQMKRKKRGGGYNLRKSLAWDRAFFTEEGVLDPLELSVISGASCGEGLPFINEVTPSGAQRSVKPVSLQELENNLLKELEDEDLGRDRKKDWSSVKLNSSSSNFITSTSLMSCKDPTCTGSKLGSRSGDCPRPLPLSSLKRPANVNVGKAAGKELKLLKVPGLKPGNSPSCETTKSNIPRANHVKHNQVTQSGLKSSSKSLKNTQIAYSDGNSIRKQESSFRRHSFNNKNPVLVDKADSSGPKMISDGKTPARPVHSSEGQHEPTTFAAPLSQNANVSVRTVYHFQNKAIKPSGLRMPSPSLSYFSQPKPSVLRDFSLRDSEANVRGFQKPGNLSLRDNLRRTTKAEASSNALSSISECVASPHASAVELMKSNLTRHSIQKIQDLSKNNITRRILTEEAELRKVDIEVPSQSGSCKEVMDAGFPKNFINNYPVKSESCGIEGRHPESRSELNCAIHKSETISVTDLPSKEKNTCNLLVLNHGAIKGTKSEDAFDHRVQNSSKLQSGWEETCKPDSHGSKKEQTDRFKYSPGDTDKATDEDENLLKTIERANEKLGVSQQNGSWCTGNASIEVLEHKRVKAENSYCGSKNLHADLLKEAASTEVLAGNLQAGDIYSQNALRSSPIGGSKHSINLISEVDDDAKQSGGSSEIANDTQQSGKCSEVPDTCTNIELDLHRNARLDSSDSFSPEKQICLRKSQKENDVEKLICEVPERKDANEVIETKMGNLLPPGQMHDCSSDKMIRPIISTELAAVDNFLSSESQNDLISTASNCDGKQKGNDNSDASLSETMMSLVAAVGRAQDDGDFRSNESRNVSLNIPDNVNMSNTPHQDTQRTQVDCYSSFHESRASEVFPKNIPGKLKEVGPVTQDEFANDWLVSTMSIEESESDTDNLKNVQDSRAGLAQSQESNMLDECCFKQSEHLALGNAEFIAENLVHNNEGLHFENCLLTKSLVNESCEDNELGSMEDSVTGQNEILLSSSENPCVEIQESPFKHEIGNDACPTGGLSPVTDTITDSPRFKPTEVCEDTNSSFSCLHPELDQLKVESALAPNNNKGDGVDEKSHSFVLPQNAIPFSDEWLAAVEAAGEEILTRKSGAVQNSPPDKSLPEPSPWSPVKRKNNQIGPFDCTKKIHQHSP